MSGSREDAPQRPARAAGVRVGFETVPPAVRNWLEESLGSPVATVIPQVGGMSPGPAVRLITVSGERAFMKAISTGLNADTAALFRHEMQILSVLPPASYRASLRCSYDDGHWVALLLEDVEGRHPDLSVSADRDLVRNLINMQAQELSPVPAGLPTLSLADNARIWAERWQRLEPLAPNWVRQRFSALQERVASLAERMPLTTFCHWDIREDNLLVRGDGTSVLVDWGMARVGPSWADHLLLALSHLPSTHVEELLGRHPHEAPLIVDTILGLAGSQLVRSYDPAPPGLPTIREFQRGDANALFAGARAFV